MAYMQETALIVKKEKLSRQIYRFTLHHPKLVELSRMGQFVHVLCGEKLLRRPISICSLDRENGQMDLVFEVKGEGTRWMADQNEGDVFDVLGPLGNGFAPQNLGKILLIGGGIGVPPMLGTAKEVGVPCDAILGFRDQDAAILIKDFEESCDSVAVTTDDGSLGTHGLVTDALTQKIKTEAYRAIYACGPFMMLRAIAQIAMENNIPCFVSLEERMGCGVGACLGCACKTKKDGKEIFQHVCKDGPVFPAEEVVW